MTPDLRAAVTELVDADLLPAGMGESHDFMTRLLVSARLLAPDLAKPPPAAAQALAKACRAADFGELLQKLAEARNLVAQAWAEIFGIELEIER